MRQMFANDFPQLKKWLDDHEAIPLHMHSVMLRDSVPMAVEIFIVNGRPVIITATAKGWEIFTASPMLDWMGKPTDDATGALADAAKRLGLL